MGVCEGRGPNVRPSAHSEDGRALREELGPRAPQCRRWSGVRGETRSLPSLCAGVRSSRVTVRGSERPPHSGVEGHFLGGFQAVDAGAGPESGGRSLRTPTCRRGHLQYLSSGPPYDFPRYRSTVHEVTQVFAAASREVLAVEAELAGPRAQPLLASHVRSLQQLEETRLTTVRPHSRGLGPRCTPWGKGHILSLQTPPLAPQHRLYMPQLSRPLRFHLRVSGLAPSFLPPLLSVRSVPDPTSPGLLPTLACPSAPDLLPRPQIGRHETPGQVPFLVTPDPSPSCGPVTRPTLPSQPILIEIQSHVKPRPHHTLRWDSQANPTLGFWPTSKLGL